MGYIPSYTVSDCCDCVKMDLTDESKYAKNEYWCSHYRKYFKQNSSACRYFIYAENRSNRGGGCYLTTLVCDVLNLQDSTLDTLRNFRESYMKKDISLLPLLYEYDIVGPIISEKLKNDSFLHTRALIMFENYIKPITKLLEDKKYTKAINKYKIMVDDLKIYYNIETPQILISKCDINIENLGKGHCLSLKKQTTKT